MKWTDRALLTSSSNDKGWFVSITDISRQECETLLYVLKKGINCATIQNKPEGQKILLLINELETFLKGE